MSNRVLLVSMPIKLYMKDIVDKEIMYNPSMGLIAISTYLEFNGYESKILDYCYEIFSVNKLINEIEEYKPSLVALSAYTENISDIFKIARKIKRRFKDIKIACGGAHPTLLFKECIENKNIDFVIRREGESTFIELMEAIVSDEKTIKLRDVNGLVYKNNGEIIVNKVRGDMLDLDLLPILNRESMGIEKYNDTVNIYTSKGCPARCIYCSATAISGAKYRMRSARNVFMEIVLLKKLLKDKLRMIYMVDDTFTVNKERVLEFVKLMKEYNLDIEWQCESRVDSMDQELASKMSEANCTAIQFGIESGSQKTLDNIRKNIDLNAAKKVIKFIREEGMEPQLSFMLGHFCDTKSTMEETYEFIKKVKKYKPKVAVSYNTPFPGTWQYTHRDELGLRLLSEDYSQYTLMNPMVETDNFTINDQLEFNYRISQII